MDYIFCAEQIEVPNDLPSVMKAFTKEVIRYGPKDVVKFSKEYFAACAEGDAAREAFLDKHERNSLNPDGVKSRRGSLRGGVPQEEQRGPAVEYGGKSKNNFLGGGEGAAVFGTGSRAKQHGTLRSISIAHEEHPPTSTSPLPETMDSQARKRAIYKKAFDKYDHDESGNIDTAELKDLLGELNWDNSQSALDQACSVLDKDGDGTIDLEEFLKWADYAWNFQAMAGASRKTSLSVQITAEKNSGRGKDKRRKSLLDVVGE